jgi:uncharacterized pyridoxamine 5'-phosphate oxidase family protein
MEAKRISIGEAKKRIKNDPELSKMLVLSGWREIALDIDGDGLADVSFSSGKFARKIDTIAIDLTGNGEYNLYLHDHDGNGIPDTIILVDDNGEEQAVAFGGEVELGFINLGVKIANLLVAEDFMNKELGLSLADLAKYLELHAAAVLAEYEKRQNAEGIEKVYYFLDDAQTYYLATVEGNQPRVRPFGTALLYEGKLYIQTGKVKNVSKQIAENPLVEICAFMDGTWLRLAGELVDDDNRDVKVAMLEKMPALKAMYSADDENTQVFYFKNATATFSSFTAEPEVITF